MTNGGIAGVQCRVRILYCGQGMANFLEFSTLDGQGKETLRGAAFVDFGVDHESAENSAGAVKVVCDRLKLLQSPAGIGFVAISHQDTDHWGIIDPLVNELARRNIRVQIGAIHYAGADWSDTAHERLLLLAERSEDPRPQIVPMKPDRSDYYGPGFPAAQLGNWGPIVVRVLCANIPVQTSGPLRKNGTSAVIVVECEKQTVLLPGDATYETFAYINNIFGMYGGQSPLNTCVAMSIPHHGAYASFVGPKETLADSAGKRFAEHVGALNAVASAGWKHHHPRKDILDLFAFEADIGDFHDYAAYPTNTAKDPTTYNTPDGIFTTLTRAEDPGSSKNYAYRVRKMAGQPAEVALTEHGPDLVEREVFVARAPET